MFDGLSVNQSSGVASQPESSGMGGMFDGLDMSAPAAAMPAPQPAPPSKPKKEKKERKPREKKERKKTSTVVDPSVLPCCGSLGYVLSCGNLDGNQGARVKKQDSHRSLKVPSLNHRQVPHILPHHTPHTVYSKRLPVPVTVCGGSAPSCCGAAESNGCAPVPGECGERDQVSLSRAHFFLLRFSDQGQCQMKWPAYLQPLLSP